MQYVICRSVCSPAASATVDHSDLRNHRSSPNHQVLESRIRAFRRPALRGAAFAARAATIGTRARALAPGPVSHPARAIGAGRPPRASLGPVSRPGDAVLARGGLTLPLGIRERGPAEASGPCGERIAPLPARSRSCFGSTTCADPDDALACHYMATHPKRHPCERLSAAVDRADLAFRAAAAHHCEPAAAGRFWAVYGPEAGVRTPRPPYRPAGLG